MKILTIIPIIDHSTMCSQVFFRVDHKVDISSYLIDVLVLYYSRQLAFLTTSLCTSSPIMSLLAPQTLKSSSFLLSILGATSNHIPLTYRCPIKIRNQNRTCLFYNTMTHSKIPHTFRNYLQ
jgi:hypothetical protein